MLEHLAPTRHTVQALQPAQLVALVLALAMQDVVSGKPHLRAVYQASIFGTQQQSTATDSYSVQALQPAQLAALVSALVMPDVVSGKPHLRADIQASNDALEAVFSLEPLQAHLQDVEAEAGLQLPLEMDIRLAGV